MYVISKYFTSPTVPCNLQELFEWFHVLRGTLMQFEKPSSRYVLCLMININSNSLPATNYIQMNNIQPLRYRSRVIRSRSELEIAEYNAKASFASLMKGGCYVRKSGPLSTREFGMFSTNWQGRWGTLVNGCLIVTKADTVGD